MAPLAPLGRAALAYAEQLGWPCVPAWQRAKSPRVSDWPRRASREPGEVAAWWRRWPESNVAVATGRRSGLVVLDVDGDDGHDSLHELERRHGPLPDTPRVKTPRGGEHLYLAHPGGVVPPSVAKLAPGLDVRAEGACVIVPPSVGGNGRRYTWDVSPLEVAPPAMPAWLAELVVEDRGGRRASTPTSEWLRIAAGVAEGERNAALARLVGHLLRRDVDAELVAGLAQLVNARNRPPLACAEVERVVESIAGRELRRRNGGRP